MGHTIGLDNIIIQYKKSFSNFNSKFGLMPSSKIEDGLFFGIEKWENNFHFCMNSYILEVLSKIESVSGSKVESIARLTVPMELIIQSLDDSVDEKEMTKNDRWKNEVSKFFNIVFLFNTFFEIQLTDKKDIVKSFALNRDPKVVKITKKIAQNVMEFTDIPFAEKKFSEKILKTRKLSEESELFLECMLMRAKAIGIYFEVIKEEVEVDAKGFKVIQELVRYNRVLELFEKDLFDISRDTFNSSPSPASTLRHKYPIEADFEKKINLCLNRIIEYKTKDSSIKRVSSNFFNAKDYCEDLIEERVERIKAILKNKKYS